jgi:hypothetical protein
MKVQPILLVALAAASLVFSGCTTATTTTTSKTDQTQKRVYTEDELRKTGETDTGPALEKVDPSVTTTRHP